MTSAPGAALDRLRSAAADGTLDAICDRHGVRVLGAFGSALHAPEAHDLDLAVGFSTAEPDLLGLLDELTVLTSFDRIDLVPIDGAEPVLRARGLGGLGLYEREPGQFATEQMAAWAEERDTAWLRRLDLDLMSP
jgi:predicted nucleotidyltransferase